LLKREGQQQVLRAAFPGIRESVKELIGKKMDALARKFHETHDTAVSDEIYRLSRELIKLGELAGNTVIEPAGDISLLGSGEAEDPSRLLSRVHTQRLAR
jgi:hypothetical protein